MGTMTGQQFIDELTVAFENRSDTAFNDNRLLLCLNQVYYHMTHPSVHEFQEVLATYDITLVQNDFDYTMAAGTIGYQVVAIHSIHYLDSAAPTYETQRNQLKPRDLRWYDDRSHSNGPPRFFALAGGDLLLVSPTPGANEAGDILRCRWWRQPEALTDVTYTVLPSYFDLVLLIGAQSVLEYRLGYRDRARESLEHYTALLNDPRQRSDIEGRNWGFESQLISEPIMETSS